MLKPDGLLFVTTPVPRFDPVCKLLGRARLLQKRSSPHSHLTDLRDLRLFEPVERRIKAVISQWAVLRPQPANFRSRPWARFRSVELRRGNSIPASRTATCGRRSRAAMTRSGSPMAMALARWTTSAPPPAPRPQASRWRLQRPPVPQLTPLVGSRLDDQFTKALESK